MLKRVIIAASIAALIFAPALFVFDVLGWLRTAEWAPVRIRTAWAAFGGPELRFAWLGVQKIADYLLDLPLSGGCLMAGILLMWLYVAHLENRG